MKQKLNFENQKKKGSKSSQEISDHFTSDFTLDLELVRKKIGHNSDVNFREFHIGGTGVCAAVIFVDGLSDKELIEKHIMKSLMVSFSEKYNQESPFVKGDISKEFIKNQILSISELTEVHDLKDLVSKVLTGSTALLVDGVPNVLILGTTKGKSRNIEEPVSEVLVRGPRVGFTETLSDNTALLRQHGDNRDLSIINFQVGLRTKNFHEPSAHIPE